MTNAGHKRVLKCNNYRRKKDLTICNSTNYCLKCVNVNLGCMLVNAVGKKIRMLNWQQQQHTNLENHIWHEKRDQNTTINRLTNVNANPNCTIGSWLEDFFYRIYQSHFHMKCMLPFLSLPLSFAHYHFLLFL